MNATIKAGTEGMVDTQSKRKNVLKCRFRETVTLPVEGRETWGCGEFARAYVVVRLEGRRVSVRETLVEIS